MFQKQPGVVITDEQKSISSALRELQDEGIWSGLHLHDNYHILRNLKKKISDKNLLRYFAAATKCHTDGEYRRILNIIRTQSTQSDLNLLEKFE